MTSSAGFGLSPSPRDWQVEAHAAWEANGQKGTVAVVTGAGKTVFAQMCMLTVRVRQPAIRFAVAVPTIALLDQWRLSLREDLNLRDDQIAVFAEGDDPPFSDVNLMTHVSARVFAPRLTEVGPAMLVADECHRLASPANSTALRARYEAALGLSATPEREHDELFQEIVAPAVGEIIFRYDYEAALRDGIISPFQLINVRVPLMADEAERYDLATKQIGRLSGLVRRGEADEAQIRNALQRRARIAGLARMRVPFTVRVILDRAPERTLIFHESISEAEAIGRLLRDGGRRVATYHSKLGPALRLDNLRLYRQRSIDILVTCRALDEGINVPDTTLGVIASGTGSSRQRIQRLGRILRPSPGKELATMVTLYASEIEERRLAEESSTNPGAGEVSWMSGAPT